jgi:hypothetical protein
MMIATFSLDGQYRHDLREAWDDTLPTAVWCLMNPSIAGIDGQPDPTWRKGVGFSKRLGYGGQVFVNLSDYICTKLPAGMRPSWSECNDEFIMRAAAQGDGTVICAWGALARGWPRAAAVTAMLRGVGFRTMALGFTADGIPRHPLMLPYSTPLEVWDA